MQAARHEAVPWLGRTPAHVDAVVGAIRNAGGQAVGVPTDATKESDVIALFDRADRESEGRLDLVIYNAGNAAMGQLHDMEASFFEAIWRVGCFGGFLVGREAVRRMRPNGCTVSRHRATARCEGTPNPRPLRRRGGLRSLANRWRAPTDAGIHVAQSRIYAASPATRSSRAFDVRACEGEDGLTPRGPRDAYWYLYTQRTRDALLDLAPSRVF